MTPRSATPVPHGLSEDQIAAEPMTQFARWMADALASDMPEPTAMMLSTITEQGRQILPLWRGAWEQTRDFVDASLGKTRHQATAAATPAPEGSDHA